MALYMEEQNRIDGFFAKSIGIEDQEIADRGLAAISVGVVKQPELSSDSSLIHEREWRLVLPSLLDNLLKRLEFGIVWASGPMEQGALLDVFPCIFDLERSRSRYFLPECRFFHTEGYTSSWCSFEYSPWQFRRLMLRDQLDFEYTRLCFLFCQGLSFEELAVHRFADLDFFELLQKDAVAAVFERHFEGGLFVGRPEYISPLATMIPEDEPGSPG